MRFVQALIVSLTMAACATNPVTGKKELSFMSEAQEIQLGKELDAQVRQEMGVYQNDTLQRYVQEIGMRLATRSQRPNLPWTFVILDSPAVNAFALPGGHIYITRGILPYLDNEAQLVGVLGHEIGHVTARHSAQAYTRGTAASIGVLIGSIFVPEIRPFADLASGGLGVIFLKFGRDDELQADALGAEYTAGGGWDPEQVPVFLNTLARITEASDRNGVPNWLSTHPQPENRAARVTETVKKVASTKTDGGTWTINHDGYLDRLHGIVFGDNPEDGIVRGNVFLHAPLRFAIEFPAGWDVTNSDVQVIAQEPGNKVFIILRTIEPGGARSLEGIARQHMREEGYKPTDGKLTTINGMQAFVGTYQGKASGIGNVMAKGAHVSLGRSTYFIGGVASPSLFTRVVADFDKTIQSFREMSQDEADTVKPNLVDFYIARTGDTWQSIAQREGDGLVSANTLAIMNNHPIDQQPTPGTRLKIVVAGS